MKKTVKRIFAMIAVVAIIMSIGLVGVSAAETVSGTTATFYKYLTMKEQANVPQVTFNFTIAPVAPATGRTDDICVEEIRDESTTEIISPRVYATDSLSGTPTISSSVTFHPGDTTYDSVQTGDTVNLESGYKYAKLPLTLTFSSVTYTKPGIYRYKITETESTNDGITNDTNSIRYCDVYVNQNPSSDEQDLQIQGYCIHESANAILTKDYGNWNDYGTAVGTGELKDNGFENGYETYDLTVKKRITGNQGWKNNYFQFTLTIDGVLPNSRYDVDLSNTTSDDNLTATGLKSRTVGSDTVYFLEANAAGEVSYTFYLSNKNGIQEYITVYGLTAATTYNISEVYQDYNPSWTISTVDNGVATERATAEFSGSLDAPYAMGENDNEVLFTNNRVVSVATGLTLDILPYAALGIIAIVSALSIRASKKRKAIAK